MKDSSTPELWRYYNFGSARTEANALPKESCFSCHEKSAAVEHSFVQFYPNLLDFAIERKVIKQGVRIPLNAARFRRAVEEQGYDSAEALYWADKKSASGPAIGAGGVPAAAFALDEPALNEVGYLLLQGGRKSDGVRVFELVTREYPQSANAYDSLADGYFAAGRLSDATAATKKSLALLEKSPVSVAARQGIEQAAKQRLEQIGKN